MSQKSKILFHLQNAGAIGLTPLDAVNAFGVFRLAARIYDLRLDGHNIISIPETVNKKTFSRYVLITESQ